jgi:hypothetical protein
MTTVSPDGETQNTFAPDDIVHFSIDYNSNMSYAHIVLAHEGRF